MIPENQRRMAASVTTVPVMVLISNVMSGQLVFGRRSRTNSTVTGRPLAVSWASRICSFDVLIRCLVGDVIRATLGA